MYHRYTPLPIILSNVRSLRHKMGELHGNVAFLHEHRNSHMVVLTETWLDDLVNDDHLRLSGYSGPVRLDRDKEITGGKHGGGVCMYIKESWCNNVFVQKICSSEIELLVLSTHPFYLPREFAQLYFLVVYIHPRAKMDLATEVLMKTLNKLDLAKSPHSPKFILGDFNQCQLDNVLKGYYQYISCATRADKILDRCYGLIQGAYKSVTMPPLGSADHNTILLASAYTPVVRHAERQKKDP